MENERNNILDEFEYGFCDISGEPIDKKEIDLGWNEEIFGLLKEVYPVIGRMNIETNEEMRKIRMRSPKNHFQFEEINALTVWDTLSNYNDKVIELRQLLYKEIELSQYVYFEDNSQYSGSKEHWLRIGKLPKCLENKDILDEIQAFTFIEVLNNRNNRNEVELAKFLMERFSRLRFANDRLTIILECMVAIKNSGVVPYVDKVWNLFLLRLYSKVLLDEEAPELDKINDNTNDEYDREIIRKVYSKLDKYLLQLQNDNSKNILMLNFEQQLETKEFYGNGAVRQLHDALFSNIDLRTRYIDTNRNSNNSSSNGNGGSSNRGPSNGCFAVMCNKSTGKKYAAISGLFDASRYIYQGVTKKKTIERRMLQEQKYANLVHLLQILLGTSFMVINSDDDVKYYCKKNGKMRTVTAYQFINSVLPFNKIPGRRMFSCCERKLSTMLSQGDTHEIYVKYKPCKLCARMIDEENISATKTITCYYWKVIPDLQKKEISLFDQAARDTGII